MPKGTGTLDTASQLREPPAEEVAQTPTQLVGKAYELKYRTGLLHADASDVHKNVRRYELDERTTQTAAQRSSGQLLRELSREWGLSWALVARLCKVSPTAVRKWRRGESVSPDNRRALAHLVSFLEMAAVSSPPIQDPASWLEMPLSGESTLTPADLYLAGEESLLLELVSEEIQPHAALDHFDPQWRENYRVDTVFDVITAPDGQKSIVER